MKKIQVKKKGQFCETIAEAIANASAFGIYELLALAMATNIMDNHDEIVKAIRKRCRKLGVARRITAKFVKEVLEQKDAK
jgi:hypothetical protein